MKYMEPREIYLTYLALGYIAIDNKCMDIQILPLGSPSETRFVKNLFFNLISVHFL